jgi:glutamate-5-semialdehyde dehydrogenase
MQKLVDSIAADARRASAFLGSATQKQIAAALKTMASLLVEKKKWVQSRNARDIAAARRKGLSPAMIDRLTLSEKAIASMVQGLTVVAGLPTPIGTVYDKRVRPNGLKIYKMKVPIGVICIIYESRPNVTVDAAAICLKSQNAVILRGGSEAFHSNMALASLFAESLKKARLPRTAVQVVPTTERSAVELLLRKDDSIDLVIPRGGESLIRTVVNLSRIPVIKHYKGVCHVYVSRFADMKIALPIVVNAKVQRPGVCNAMETLLIDSRLPRSSRQAIIEAMLDEKVTLFGDKASMTLSPRIKKACEDDWYAEYLDLRLAVREVNGVQEAIDHINKYGSRHTDAIVSQNAAEIAAFRDKVDSSSIMVNASTRFSDGGEYGMGCEIGISTDKLHSRGPMGVEDLTTYKWVVEGTGQIRK